MDCRLFAFHSENDAGKNFTDAKLSELVPHSKRFAKFETLDLRVVEITDDRVALLDDLPRLRRLRLASPNVTDQGILHLHSLR